MGKVLPAADQKMAPSGPPATSGPAALPEAVRSLTHDLRNPLTALKSCLQLLIREEAGPLNSDQKRFLGLAERNINRLDRLASDMLTYARPEPARPGISPREVDLGRLLAEAVGLHALAAADKDLELDGSGIPVPFVATVDPDVVLRILDNVLGNALKFTPSGGLVRVWLEEGVGSRRGPAARLARRYGLPLATFNLIVEDSGPGLSAAVQRRVFEPFNSGPGPGTGLGLSITRQLAEDHGGRVRLASLPGRGTTFWLKLPRDPLSGSLLGAVERLQTALHTGEAGEVPPLVGVIDLRHTACDGAAGTACLQDFQPNGPRDTEPCTELVPGLWAAAVTDPVNCNRRWVLHAARLGVGLEATRWEFMDPVQAAPDGTTGQHKERCETMVNPAPAVPIIF